jgi:hypothetical protein
VRPEGLRKLKKLIKLIGTRTLAAVYSENRKKSIKYSTEVMCDFRNVDICD